MLRSSRCRVCSLIPKSLPCSSAAASSSSPLLASALPSRPTLPSSALPLSSLRLYGTGPAYKKIKKPPLLLSKSASEIVAKSEPYVKPLTFKTSAAKKSFGASQSWYSDEIIEDIRASCIDNLSQLNREIEHFSIFLRPTADEELARREAFDELASFLKEAYNAEAHAIGSLETQLYLPQGDTDVVVMVEPRPSLHKVAMGLFRQNLIYDSHVLGRARVPIIKCYSSRTNLPLDISFNKSNGIDTAKLINQYLNDSPALRPLIMILKTFLQSRGMADPAQGGLGSYSVICMAVSFFQQHPRIKTGELDPDVDPGSCLVDFMNLYGKLFDPKCLAISIADSSLPPRKQDDGDKSVLRIIDPQDSTNNIAKPTSGFVEIQKTLGAAHTYLQAALRRPFDPSTSILDRIVGTGADILAYRQRNARQLFLSRPPSSQSLPKSKPNTSSSLPLPPTTTSYSTLSPSLPFPSPPCSSLQSNTPPRARAPLSTIVLPTSIPIPLPPSSALDTKLTGKGRGENEGAERGRSH